MIFQVVLLLSSLATLAIIHWVALDLHLYWKYLWLDVPIHFLGGACVALGFSILPFFKISLPPWSTTVYAYVCVALFVGIVWEVFEVTSGVAIVDEYYIGDTTLDLCMDVLGGIIGYGVVQSVKKLEHL